MTSQRLEPSPVRYPITSYPEVLPTFFSAEELSPVESLPSDHLLSKITILSPQPIALDPYVLKAFPDSNDVTACLWTADGDIDMLPAWALRWQGKQVVIVR